MKITLDKFNLDRFLTNVTTVLFFSTAFYVVAQKTVWLPYRGMWVFFH